MDILTIDLALPLSLSCMSIVEVPLAMVVTSRSMLGGKPPYPSFQSSVYVQLTSLFLPGLTCKSQWQTAASTTPPSTPKFTP